MMGLTNSILFEKIFFFQKLQIGIFKSDFERWNFSNFKFYNIIIFWFSICAVHSYFDFSSFSIRIYVYNLMALLNCIFGGNKKAFFYCLHGQQGPSMMYFFSAYVHYLAEHVSNKKLRICIRRRPQKFGPSSSYKLTLLFK